MKLFNRDKKGRKRVITALILIIVGGISLAAWRLMQSDETKPEKTGESKVACISDDRIICKFITNWAPSTEYRTVIDDDTGGVNTVTTYEYELGAMDKIHTVVEGVKSYEVITIGDAIYTKAGDTWWKRVMEFESETNRKAGRGSSQPQEFEPLKPSKYSRVGKESCDQLQCYKYAVNDPSNPETKQFVWFDDQEYRLRKISFETAGSSVEQTFEYTDVAINKPSPVRELGPDQQLTPGDPAPTGI